MTFLTNAFETIKTNLFNTYSKDAGKMLLHTGTIAWTFSALGQIFGIAKNDKISKEQKSFLIPQEMADAAINIASFYTVTSFLQNNAKRLAYSGKIINPLIKDFCQGEKIKFGKWSNNIGNEVSKTISDYKATIETLKAEKFNLKTEEMATLEQKIAKYEKFQDKIYDPFEDGIKIIGNVFGAVLSSNIITPLLRNPIAGMKQKQDIALDKIQAQEKKDNEALSPYSPVIPMQNRMGIDAYKSKVMSPSSGAMRI